MMAFDYPSDFSIGSLIFLTILSIMMLAGPATVSVLMWLFQNRRVQPRAVILRRPDLADRERQVIETIEDHERKAA